MNLEGQVGQVSQVGLVGKSPFDKSIPYLTHPTYLT